MTYRLNCHLYFVIGCLFILSMPTVGYCETAYEQLEEAAGHRVGNAPDPGEPERFKYDMGNGNPKKDAPYANNKARSPQTINPAIAGMLAKQRDRERYWTAQLQKTDQEIQKCNKDIALANTIISKARMTGRIEAESIARQNLIKAERLKQRQLEKKRIAEQQLRQATESVKKLSGTLMNESTPANVRGVVSQSSGSVSLLRPNSGPKAVSLTGSEVGYLEPGDEIQTGKDSRAELQILSGRGAMSMGGNSKFKVEEDHGDAEVVKTLEGNFHFVVDKVEKMETAMEKNLVAIKDNLVQTVVDSEAEFERFLKGMKAKMEKRFEVKNRSSTALAVRGTEFTVYEKQDGSCELVVIDGKVVATEPNQGKSIMVETGQSLSISSDGKLAEVRAIDPATLTPWWR